LTRRAAGAITATVLAFSALVAGCGGAAKQAHLAWIGTPQVFAPGDLPRDRVVVGRIRNFSKVTLQIKASSLRVRDARDQILKASAGFTVTYAHGLFGAFQQPGQLPIRELVRLGRIAILEPGAASPLFAAWRLPPGAREPVTIDYGSGTLAVPVAAKPTAP
jgi:hypothetical protein